MAAFVTETIGNHITKILVPGNVCAFLVEGQERAALIDTGFGVGSLRDFVTALTDKPVVVILTHGHYDHVGGAGEWRRVYIHENDVGLALAHAKKPVRQQALASVGVEASEDELAAELSQAQIRRYGSEETFDLGGIAVQMLPLFGHTRGMHCPLFVEERLVLLGDACNSATFMQFDEATSISAYQASLRDFLARYDTRYDQVAYSHPHNFGGKEIIGEMIDLCSEVLAPGFAGQDFSAMLGPGTLMAKPVNEAFAPLDGSCANMVYTLEKVR